MKKILAKSSGIDLMTHSKNVLSVSLKILDKVIENPTEENKTVIRLASLLHDIGKCTNGFQKMLRGTTKNSGNKYRHNEIGWAFVYRYLNVDAEILKQVLDVIYWHHGISNSINADTHLSILASVKQPDINIMKTMMIELVGSEYVLEVPRDATNYAGKKSPLYYDFDEESNFPILTINRTCVISGDKLASKLEEKNQLHDVDSIIEKYLTKENDFKFNECPNEYRVRFLRQVEISNLCQKTTVLKAPAGFGKTLTGLIWSSLSHRKLIWVCPRNEVARSVYQGVLDEAKVFGLNIKVELFLTGEIKKSNHGSDEAFSSDIIITNIDNFLSPTIDSRHSDRLFMINNSDVIFDEHHELVSEAGLFSSFITLMRTRNRYTDSRTLLLSATPIGMEFLWEAIDRKTTMLPNKSSHYPAAHNKKYKLNVMTGLPTVSDGNNLIIFNSISQAQINKNIHNCREIIHSQFNPDELETKIDNLFKKYGKKSYRRDKKGNLIGTLIIQASLDVSFDHLFESILSPETTLQRIGRCDRWGDCEGESTITVFKVTNSNSENKLRSLLYDRNISDVWYEFLEQYNGKSLTLDEFYILYNKFNEDNERLIHDYIVRKYNESLTSLVRVYPIKFEDKKGASETITAGSSRFRSFGNEIFYITRIHDSEEYTSPFSTRIYTSIGDDFGEVGNILPRIKGVFRTLIRNNDTRYVYNDLMDNKNLTIDNVRFHARKSNTPYVRFDKIYHKDYGLINIEVLQYILNAERNVTNNLTTV